MQRKPVIIVAILSVVSLGLRYWVGIDHLPQVVEPHRPVPAGGGKAGGELFWRQRVPEGLAAVGCLELAAARTVPTANHTAAITATRAQAAFISGL